MILQNPDSALANNIRKALLDNDGYCITQKNRTADNVCICTTFKDMIKDKREGFCPCKLYLYQKD